MIKNILYSIFVHLILFSVLYYGFIKNHKEELTDGLEVTITLADIKNDNSLPLREIIPKEITQREIINKNIKELPKEDEKDVKLNQKNDKQNPPNIASEKAKELSQITQKDDKKELPTNIDTKEKTTELRPVESGPMESGPMESGPMESGPMESGPTEKIKNVKLNDFKPEEKIKKIIEEVKDKSENNKSTSGKSNSSDNLKVINLKPNQQNSEEINDSSLSSRETINIKSQLKLCYKRAIVETGLNSNTKVIITININPLGYIETNLDEIIDLDKYNDSDSKNYKIVIDNVRRALDLCSPLRNLPIEKYQSWKEIILQFDSE